MLPLTQHTLVTLGLLAYVCVAHSAPPVLNAAPSGNVPHEIPGGSGSSKGKGSNFYYPEVSLSYPSTTEVSRLSGQAAVDGINAQMGDGRSIGTVTNDVEHVKNESQLIRMNNFMTVELVNSGVATNVQEFVLHLPSSGSAAPRGSGTADAANPELVSSTTSIIWCLNITTDLSTQSNPTVEQLARSMYIVPKAGGVSSSRMALDSIEKAPGRHPAPLRSGVCPHPAGVLVNANGYSNNVLNPAACLMHQNCPADKPQPVDSWQNNADGNCERTPLRCDPSHPYVVLMLSAPTGDCATKTQSAPCKYPSYACVEPSYTGPLGVSLTSYYVVPTAGN